MIKKFIYIFIIVLTSCSSNNEKTKDSNEIKLTVVKYDNQNSDFEEKKDTLINSQIFEISETKIDMYFTWKNFQIPYYMPSGSIYKDTVKTKECDGSKYPVNVKCYEYDVKNRVVKMQVEGSGTMGLYTFKYDESDRIIEMTDNGKSIYNMKYDMSGNLLVINIENTSFQKRLEFYYIKE